MRTRFAVGVLLAPIAGTAACGRLGGGIPLSAISPPLVRVQLGSPRDSAALVLEQPWEASAEAGRPFRDASSAPLATPVAAGAAGIVFRGLSTGATALRVRSVGAFALSVGDARQTYRGDLLVRQQGGALVFVNEVDLESYVAGVVVNEIGGGMPPAAYRAQAVVARTYAYVRWRAAPDASTHVFDDQRSQVYRGLTVPAAAGVSAADLDRLVGQTRGVVLTWRSEPFPAYYHSTCGGHTTDAATAGLDPGGATEPLRGVDCPFCGKSKYFAWTEEVPLERLLASLRPRGVVAPISEISWTKTGPGAWIAEATVTYGPKGAKKVVPGPEFRSAAGLRSMHVTSVSPTPGGLLVKGSGWGHGVGMCQVGAQEMARRGCDETEILRWYYPGAEFTRLY